jgi:integrase
VPKLHYKEETLNGRAHICAYADREYLYLRIPKGNRTYSNISLQTTNIKLAHQKALDVYTATVNSPIKKRGKKYLFSTACEKFLEYKQEQCKIGEIKPSTASTYEQRVYQRILPYAKEVRVKLVSDINKETFDRYGVHYRQVTTKGKWKTSAQGLSVSTINSDITTLNEILEWMVRNDILEFKVLKKLEKLRDKKDHREDSNPAYMPDEWEQIKKTLIEWETKEDDPSKKWKRRWYKNFVFFMYHGGFRLHEAKLLTLGDIDVVRRDGKVRWGVVEVPPNTKTGKRTTIMNGNWLNSVKYHLNAGIKIRNEEIREHNLKVEEGTLEVWRACKTKIEPIAFPPNKDCRLFSNPFGYLDKAPAGADKTYKWKTDHGIDLTWHAKVNLTPHTDETIRQKLDSIFAHLEFYQKKNYTLHSLRSSHITHALILKGMNIRQIADNVGNSQAEIERTYYRLNNLLNMEKLGFFKDELVKKEELVVSDD